MSSDLLAFVRSWVDDPLRVGAIAPSSERLARLITDEVVSVSGCILELGPGTGVFARMLVERGVRERDLVLVESSVAFAGLLKGRYSEALVCHMDAARLARARVLDGVEIGGAVSGLPLLAMKPRAVMGVLSGVFKRLRPGASVYQFTYGFGCPVQRRILDRLGLKATCIRRTLLNIPPATVYRITRHPSKRP